MAVLAFSISAGLEASTVTPGSTAPVASLTTPAIPLACCAEPTVGIEMTLRRTTEAFSNCGGTKKRRGTGTSCKRDSKDERARPGNGGCDELRMEFCAVV